MEQPAQTRQQRRAREIKALEYQVKELTRLLDITTNGLKKAAALAMTVSPDAAVNLKAVVKTVNEQKDKVLNAPKS